MKIAIIGRNEILYKTAEKIVGQGHDIPLIITAKEAPEYTKTASDFDCFAKSINAEFIYSPRINNPEITEKIKKIGKIDIALSMNYPGIIEQKVIDCFNLGILNAHGGDLPRYRGNACQAWAIINGEEKIGLCIHKMVAGELDSGDIILKEYLPIDINTKIHKVYEWISDRIPEMMLKSIAALAGNADYYLEHQSKDPKNILRCYPRKPEDAKIDWQQSSTEILRLINASSEPYQGAFCIYNSSIARVWDALLYSDSENYLAVPGQVLKINKDDGSIVVATGKGKILVKEIELDNSRSAPANYIKSLRDRLT